MTVTVTAITDPVTCTHPAEARTTRTDHGSYDYVYDVCAACASESLTCQDDDDCGICTEGGQWSPILVPQYVPAEHLEAAGLTGADEDAIGAYLDARYEAWKQAAGEAPPTDEESGPLSDSQRFQVEEARDCLGTWDLARGDNAGIDRERVLADQLRAMLAVIDRVAPKEADR